MSAPVHHRSTALGDHLHVQLQTRGSTVAQVLTYNNSTTMRVLFSRRQLKDDLMQGEAIGMLYPGVRPVHVGIMPPIGKSLRLFPMSWYLHLPQEGGIEV